MARDYRLGPPGGGPSAAADSPPIVAPGRFRIDYERELNPAQLEAACAGEGAFLVIAGAGTGKTRTLIYRVARLVEAGVQPSSILLLTFTRKAAEQMLGRAAALVGAGGPWVQGGTFHSFACIALRQYGAEIGLQPGFSILDEGDAADTIHLVKESLDLPPTESRFPTRAMLREVLTRARNRELPVSELIALEYPQFVEHTDAIVSILEAYARHKLEHQMVDFDDLLLHLETLLARSDGVRRALAARHRFVMVDEYQDTNPVQARITRLLAAEHGNVMVVGDDAQSIYGFRGACVENILEFPRQFPDARLIRLETNYRSVQTILDCANRLIAHAPAGFAKTLRGVRGVGDRPAMVPCVDEVQQAEFICQRVLELREDGVPLSQQAVLIRSGFHSFQLEIELARRNIPFEKWGGFRFVEASHIKDVVSHLRVIANPQDRVAWQRILSLLPGCGAKTVAVLSAQLATAIDPWALEDLPVRPRVREGLARLGPLLRALRAPEVSPVLMIERVCDYYLPLLPDRFPDDHPRRRRDLDHLATIAGRYQGLVQLLADLAIDPPSKSVAGSLASDLDDEDRLVLSTIHSAKGMEWHSVFVLWLLEGRFPPFKSLRDPAALEEERRLMYVAVTRARENLAICYPVSCWDRQTGSLLTQPSRFLEEIGAAALETWRLT